MNGIGASRKTGYMDGLPTSFVTSPERTAAIDDRQRVDTSSGQSWCETSTQRRTSGAISLYPLRLSSIDDARWVGEGSQILQARSDLSVGSPHGEGEEAQVSSAGTMVIG